MTPGWNAKKDNAFIFAMVANYLNLCDCAIDQASMQDMKLSGLPSEECFAMMLSYVCGLDIDERPEDMALYRRYFPAMVHRLDTRDYQNNPYLKTIPFTPCQVKQWTLRKDVYAPYQGFVAGDIVRYPDGRQIPQIGFFEEPFAFPAIYEGDRLWMSVVPNEIETMKAPIAKCHGKVATLGLGMGYFAFMVAEKPEVDEVLVVERDEAVISLFVTHILPHFPHKDKVHILHQDAFDFLDSHKPADYDILFCDIWHDVGDGLPLYLRIKDYEPNYPTTQFFYWIETSMQCYL